MSMRTMTVRGIRMSLCICYSFDGTMLSSAADLPHSPIVTQSSLRSSAPNKSTHSPSHACAGNSSELRSSVQSTRGGVGVWPRMSQAAGSTLLLPCSFDGSSSSSSSCDRFAF